MFKRKKTGRASRKESLQPEMTAFLLSAAIWQRWEKAGRPQAENKEHLHSHTQENHSQTLWKVGGAGEAWKWGRRVLRGGGNTYIMLKKSSTEAPAYES